MHLRKQYIPGKQEKEESQEKVLETTDHEREVLFSAF